MMIHYCNRLVRWQLHNIQPLRTFFQSGNVKNALRLYITCIETQGENSNCAVPLYFTRNPCAPHRPVTAVDRLCLLAYSKTLLSTGCPRTSSAASFRCLTPSGSSLCALSKATCSLQSLSHLILASIQRLSVFVKDFSFIF